MAYTTIDDPSAYFQTTLYSGTGSQQSITNGGNSDLQPDWLWIKDRDGTYKGYDIGIIEKIVDHSSVPVTAVGGARSFDDLKELSETCGLMGVAAGTLWCFKEPNKAVLLNYPNPRAKTEIFQ